MCATDKDGVVPKKCEHSRKVTALRGAPKGWSWYQGHAQSVKWLLCADWGWIWIWDQLWIRMKRDYKKDEDEIARRWGWWGESPTCPSEDKAAPPARCTPTLFAANDIWPEIFFRIIFIDLIMILIDDHQHQHCHNNKLRSLFTHCRWITNLKSAWYCLTWWTDYIYIHQIPVGRHNLAWFPD